VKKLVLLVALVGCGGPYMPMATEADGARASSTADELNRGRTLLLSDCKSCHQPPSPRDLRAADWPSQVEEMRERAHVSPPDAEAITRYLVTFASEP